MEKSEGFPHLNCIRRLAGSNFCGSTSQTVCTCCCPLPRCLRKARSGCVSKGLVNCWQALFAAMPPQMPDKKMTLSHFQVVRHGRIARLTTNTRTAYKLQNSSTICRLALTLFQNVFSALIRGLCCAHLETIIHLDHSDAFIPGLARKRELARDTGQTPPLGRLRKHCHPARARLYLPSLGKHMLSSKEKTVIDVQYRSLVTLSLRSF